MYTNFKNAMIISWSIRATRSWVDSGLLKTLIIKFFTLCLFVWLKRLITKEKLRTNFSIWLRILKRHNPFTKKQIQCAIYFEINWNNFENSYFSEYSQLLFPQAVAPRCSTKILFYSKTSMAESCCKYWSKSSNILR